jgi:hypothetical protein
MLPMAFRIHIEGSAVSRLIFSLSFALLRFH